VRIFHPVAKIAGYFAGMRVKTGRTNPAQRH
jgi:hypothetical protein